MHCPLRGQELEKLSSKQFYSSSCSRKLRTASLLLTFWYNLSCLLLFSLMNLSVIHWTVICSLNSLSNPQIWRSTWELFFWEGLHSRKHNHYEIGASLHFFLRHVVLFMRKRPDFLKSKYSRVCKKTLHRNCVLTFTWSAFWKGRRIVFWPLFCLWQLFSVWAYRFSHTLKNVRAGYCWVTHMLICVCRFYSLIH